MALAAGTRLGPYQTLAPIGAGGMGEVYRAHDPRTGRDVAVKISAERFSDRFSREVRAVAALNHPNICQLYDVGPNYLVVELVEGPTLAERIKQGPMPLEEALTIAKQIAEAVEAAHEKGIVHRDLKPGNIKLRPDGAVKVLDFGLAKVTESSDGGPPPEDSPTLTLEAATRAGVILGTAAYMSPEQARGKEADKRSDIWSFGAVLYEILSGQRGFGGESTSDILAAVLKLEPDWNALPKKTPAAIRRLIQRCLMKDRRQRLQAIGEARIVIEECLSGAPLEIAETAPGTRNIVPWAVAAAMTILSVVGLSGWWRATRPTDRPFMWLSVDLGPDARASRDFTAAISPDGTRLVFPIGDAGASRLAVRSLGQPNATPLAGTEGGNSPFFSPDGEWVAFSAGGKLKKISIHGGPPMTLCDSRAFHGGAWGEDGFIVAALGNAAGLSQVPENGGSPQPLTKLENGELTHRWPQILPERKAVVFSASSSQNWDEADVEVLSLKTGQRKTVVRGGFYGRYLPSGHLVYLRGGTLYGMAFDIDGLEPAGPPAALLEGIAASIYGGGQFDFSRNGMLVYLTGNAPSPAKRKLVWIDAGGKTQPLFAAPDRFFSPALSPDGKRLAIVIGDVGGSDLWVYDLEREIPTKLPTGGHVLLGAVWAPDGKHLVYGSEPSGNNGVMWIRADGGGEPQQLTRDDSHSGQVPTSVSPDGRFVLIGGPRGGPQSLTIDTKDPDHPKAGPPEPLLSARIGGPGGKISPDGRWFAYTSGASGTPQVFVRPFANGKIVGSGVSQISAAGGAYPVWSRAAHQHQLLYGTSEGRIMVVDYSVEGDSFNILKSRPWTDKQILTISGDAPGGTLDLHEGANGISRLFDLTPDGRRIVAWVPEEQPKEAKVDLHVMMLLNWFDELRRRLLPSGK